MPMACEQTILVRLYSIFRMINMHTKASQELGTSRTVLWSRNQK